MDEKFYKASEDFISKRVNFHGENETEAVNEAYLELRSDVERLRETLTAEQVKLLTACENSYHVADGESGRFYYKAGFADAIKFLFQWNENK